MTPILESVHARRKSVERLEENYRQHPMPLGAIAKAGGGSTIDFAVHLAQSGQRIFSATGHASDTEREFAIARKSFDRVLVLDAYKAWLLDKLGVLKAVKDAFPNLTLPASALDEFGEMIEEMGRNPDGRKSMTAHDDGYVIHESTAEEVEEHVASLEQTRNRISGTCRVVGIEVSADADGSFLRFSDFLGSQFDCLSVIQRENGVLVSADLRLRQIATEICNEQAFGLDALLRVMAIEGAFSIEAYADVLLKLCGQGHSYVSLNGQILQRMLMADETAALERFERAADYLGTPNADIDSHIMAAADFVGRAFRYYAGGLKAKRATGIVLRRLLQFEGIELADTLIRFVSAVDDTRVTDYVGRWLKGHFLMEIVERQIEARNAANIRSQ